ncbi:MAG TPA: methyltransferase domain-containing protein, partial [Planctomycetaceae bacterium]|nr:methyltransferase domain-containing protein [Planctomycetaceae bacterium]
AARVLELAGVQGGLVVHLGCGDGRLTAALRASEAYLVHGLDPDAANVAAAREHIRSLGLYGPISVDRLSGRRLPYVDNLVNLLIAERPELVPESELYRVLAPDGVLCLRREGKRVKRVKRRPDNIDEWSHYLHDPSNNAVCADEVVGPPRRLQWVGSPRYTRHHDHMSSFSAAVTAGGRFFYILDEGSHASILLPPHWQLIARDAFSGVVLWKRSIARWHPHLWPLKSGPASLPRRLVADAERVYVTLSIDGPVSALDAATGKTVRTYKGTEGAEEILLCDGTLLVVIKERGESLKDVYNEHSPCKMHTKSTI